jgi:hypothetical protein
MVRRLVDAAAEPDGGNPLWRERRQPALSIALVCVLTVGCSGPIAPASPPLSPPVVQPKAVVVHGEGWAIAAPDDWSRFSAIRPPMVLYLIGDSHHGIPHVDGTLSALKVGLTVELFPARDGFSPRDRADKDLVDLRGTTGFEIDAEPRIEAIKLGDGTKAIRLKAEMSKPRQRRLSFYEKVYCAMPDNQHVVATGFLTCSPGGGEFVKRTGLLAFVEALAESLVLDPAKTEKARWETAYHSLNIRVGEALQKASQGNRLLETGANKRAAAAFREALEICDFLPAAHNGLAWALLQGEGSKDEDEAMRHAEAAVKLTGRRDFAALDTLALAYFRKDDRAKAIATIREALKLDPRNPDLRRSLQKYEKGS